MSLIHTNDSFSSTIPVLPNEIAQEQKYAPVRVKLQTCKLYPLWLTLFCALFTLSNQAEADDSMLHLAAIDSQAYAVSDYSEAYASSTTHSEPALFTRHTEIDISRYVNSLINDSFFSESALRNSLASSFLFNNSAFTGSEQGSNWKVAFEGVELGGAQSSLMANAFFGEEASYINRLIDESYQYLGWGTKVGKRIVLSPNFTTLIHAGAFNWEQSRSTLGSVDSGQQSGISPYGGIELNYQVTRTSEVQLKWTHFELNETQLDQFGIYFSHRF
ncbi:hypothetical protein EKG38_09780 [Shewanella canadensis]|uniref:Uncharacterized protein n=1 Tax=Shewanella canadensis TaxID=271096 RepID=A0A431WU87_9GAMM|nr:hypothetical protein [Shewanella canadensis]RTR39200.1 hypothetical protein EKG38_09780 [Shewanella canadensis]